MCVAGVCVNVWCVYVCVYECACGRAMCAYVHVCVNGRVCVCVCECMWFRVSVSVNVYGGV